MSEKKNKWEKIAEEVDRQEMAEEISKSADSEDKTNTEGVEDVSAASEMGVDADLNAAFADEFDDVDADAETIALRKELDAAKTQLLEMRASMANLESRTEREMIKARQFANERIIKKLLPVIDSLTMGLDAGAKDTSDGAVAILKGMQLTSDMLLKVLQEFGVKAIDPQPGDDFDPESHEAMTVQNIEGQADNTIVQTLQRGYALQDRVLRAAMVIVNRLA